MKCRSTRNSQTGLTLVETLVALALLGLLAAGAAGLLPLMGRLSVAAAEAQAATQTLSRSHDFLRAVIIQARPVTDLGPAAAAEPLPMTADHLRLLAPLPQGLGPGGPVLLDLRVDRRPDGAAALVLTSTPLRPGNPAGKAVLIERAGRIEWAYYDATAHVWLSSWTGRAGLPALIRLRVASAMPGDWPDLVVRPRLEQGPLCIFDLVGGECRWAT